MEITGLAGWQAEYHVYLCGLNVEEKCQWTKDQIMEEIPVKLKEKFTVLQQKFMQNGTSTSDARNQDVATVYFRIFAQSKDQDLSKMRNPDVFFRRSMTPFLQSCPGASLGNDMRQAEGKPYYEYHPALLPQAALKQRVHLLWDASQKTIDVPLAEFHTYDRQQPSYETKNLIPIDSFGPTVRMKRFLQKLHAGASCIFSSDHPFLQSRKQYIYKSI